MARNPQRDVEPDVGVEVAADEEISLEQFDEIVPRLERDWAELLDRLAQ